MAIRTIEIRRVKNDQYIIKIDGERARATWNQSSVESAEDYGCSVRESVASMILQELDSQFTLTDDEHKDYKKKLREIIGT